MPMETPRVRRILLSAMFLLAAGALLLHANIHQPFKATGGDPVRPVFSNVTAAAFGLFDVIVVTFLFFRRGTAVYGYLFNGLLVIFGTVFMTHFGWARLGAGAPAWKYLFHPMLPDVAIAWGDFLLGSVLYA